VALDITVHDCDTLRYLLAGEIVEVTALTANQGLASDDVADAVMGVMRFANGVLASFHDAFTVPHAGTGLELHGTDGSLIGRDVMTQQPKGEVYMRRSDTTEHVDIGPREGLYRRAVRTFNDAVLNGSTPSASAADGVISLQVGLAAAESAVTGQAVRVGDPFDPPA
jgi:1,5-anhydro-D-fructose reductase (1,5-anhydro-D-mannitol-forming)